MKSTSLTKRQAVGAGGGIDLGSKLVAVTTIGWLKSSIGADVCDARLLSPAAWLRQSNPRILRD